MNDGKRIRSRRDAYKIATHLRILNLCHYDIGRWLQELSRKALWRFEKRASYHSSAVSDVQNLHVNARARWLGKGDCGKIRQY
jgi:hypothetical protein